MSEPTVTEKIAAKLAKGEEVTIEEWEAAFKEDNSDEMFIADIKKMNQKLRGF